MATTFIDPSAGVNGSGTFASPKNTWAGLTISGNNSFLQKAGTTYTGTITVSGDGTGVGTETILGSYDSTGTRITGVLPADTAATSRGRINGNGTGPVISTNGKSYIIIDSLEVYGSDGLTGSLYTTSTLGHHVTFQYCYIHDGTHTAGGTSREAAGIKFFCDNFRGLYNRIDNIEGEGIYGEGDYYELAYNNITRISVGSDQGDGIQIADSVYRSNDGWIRYNYIDHSGVDVKQGIIINDTLGISRGGIIEYNQLLGPTNATACWGVLAGWGGITVRGNLIENHARGVDVTSSNGDVLIVGNVIITNSVVANTRGINFFSDGNNCKAYNNTIVNTTGTFTNNTWGIHGGSAGTGTLLKNNICKGWKIGIQVSGSGVEDYNDYFGCQTNVSGATIASHSITTDPLFTGTGDYTLQSTSPCKQTGVDPGVVVQGRTGRTMYTPFDIGAYDTVTPVPARFR